MNILVREIKANTKSLIIWSIAMFLMIAASMGKYAGLVVSGQSINELMARMPESLKAVMGVGTFDLTTVSGYYGVLYIYLVIIASAHAVLFGVNVISKEERDKTAEFLFTKPVSRASVINSKVLASLFNILVLNIVTTLSSILLVRKYAAGESLTRDITMLMAGILIMQLIFLFLGTALAAISKNPGWASSVSTGILLVTFLLSVAIDIDSRLDFLKFLTPFKYFDARKLMNGPGFEPVFLIISGFLILSLFFMTYKYRNRDLKM